MELNGAFIQFLVESGSVAVSEEALWAEFERRRAEKKKQQARVYNRKYYQKKKTTEKQIAESKTDTIKS